MSLRLEGAELIGLSPAEAEKAVDWLVGTAPRPDTIPAGLRWAVAQATDTFVWGLYTASAWKWATQEADKGVCAVRQENLLEIRAFFADAELLLWRFKDSFRGRILRDRISKEDDTKMGAGASMTLDSTLSFLNPMLLPLDRRTYFLPVRDEEGVLVGNILPTTDPDFLRRQEGNGRTTVTPFGTGVLLRNYLEQCQETGMLRIAATRFHSIFTT